MDIFLMGFVLGAAAGGLLVFAWMSDRADRIRIEPTEHMKEWPL